jgi:hypothetical protein
MDLGRPEDIASLEQYLQPQSVWSAYVPK